MNLILFNKDELLQSNILSLEDYRFHHIINIHKPKLKEVLKIGEINGDIGTGTVEFMNSQRIDLKIKLNQKPPKPLPVKLFISLPRPKTVKKLIPAIVSMGVKEIFFLNSYRVEKSYWQSPVLKKTYLQKLILKGLEQGFDTILPQIKMKKLFKPFVEDELADLIKNCKSILLHPKSHEKIIKSDISENYALFLGPEGGLIPFEVELLKKAGFTPVTLGPRILRVETASVSAIAKLF